MNNETTGLSSKRLALRIAFMTTVFVIFLAICAHFIKPKDQLQEPCTDTIAGIK